MSLSISNSSKSRGVLFNGNFVLSNEGSKRCNLDVKFFNNGIVENNVLSFLSSKFFKELVNQTNDLGELILVDFLRRSSKFGQNANNGSNKGRRGVSKVLLEENNDVSELSLSLDERSGIRLERGQKLE